jgi:hypothetical protein
MARQVALYERLDRFGVTLRLGSLLGEDLSRRLVLFEHPGVHRRDELLC